MKMNDVINMTRNIIKSKDIMEMIYKLRGVEINLSPDTHGFILFNTLCLLSPKINKLIDEYKEVDDHLMKLVRKKLIVDDYISKMKNSMLEEGFFSCAFPRVYI